MRARVPDAPDAIDLADGAEQVGEQRAHRDGLARPSAGEREIAAVAVHVLPQQGDLGDTV
jgi:hypothetical protein